MRILFLLLFSVILLNINGYSQTIQIGSGTTTNGVTTNSPINIWFRKTVAQMVYTKAELNAAGITGPGTINQLGFYVTNPPIYALPSYTIEMRHTTNPNAGTTITGGYTTVVNSFDYAPGYGWDMINLDTPFDWNGTDNLVVRICFSQVSPSFDPSGQVRVFSSTSGYRYRRSDTGGSACGQNPNTTLNTKPQIRFVFDSQTEWTGAISTDANDAGNWTAGVPNETMDALIPAGTPNNPLINTALLVKNLINEGEITLGLNGQLDIYSSFTNNNTFIDLGGIVRTTGTEPCTISPNAPFIINNLIARTSGGTTISGGELTIGNELQVNKGDFNSGGNLIIKSDAFGTARISEIRTTCTFTLTMTDLWGDGWNGGFLTIYEDGVAIEEFSGQDASSTGTFKIEEGSTYSLEYTAGSYENENAYTLSDESGGVLFTDGPTPSTGTVFTSTASGCLFSPTIIGDITVETYIDGGETWWRYFGSAVTGATIDQYNDDFVTAGYPGSWFPDFGWTSIYTYDETMAPGLGYIPVSTSSDVIGVGEGLQVWCGDTITGTLEFTVDLKGPANQGDIHMPVSYTATGTPSEDGWCLISNPYASTIDWDSPNWGKTNMANAVYIQNPDNQLYASYVAGASTNGGSRYIAAQQSFWVQATAASPQLLATEKVKTNASTPFIKAGYGMGPGMTMVLHGGAFSDECVIRTYEGTSDDFEPSADAIEYFGGWGTHPQLSVVNGEGRDLSIHTFDNAYDSWNIPLRVIVFESGTYELVFNNIGELDVPCLKLLDTYTALEYSIDEGTALSFEMSDTTYTPRFVLKLGNSYDQVMQKTTCNGSADGSYTIDLNLESEITYSLTHDGETITGTGTGNPLVISDLSFGGYLIEFEDLDNLCSNDAFAFSISEPSELTTVIEDDIYSLDDSYFVNLESETVGGTAPYSYIWSNGSLEPNLYGVSLMSYELLVKDANDCESTYYYNADGVVLESESLQEEVELIYSSESKTFMVYGLDQNDSNSEIIVTNLAGQIIWRTSSTLSSNGTLKISLPEDLSQGIYILQIGNSIDGYKFSY